MTATIANEEKKLILDTCKKLYHHGWLAACDGNVSMRVDDDLILMTPSQKHKGFLVISELALVTLQGEVIEGKPSSEMQMHLALYRNCVEAKAVVHAHTPVSTAWSIACPDLKELPMECSSEMIPTLGSVPIVPYVRPGTREMGEALTPFLPESKVMILSNHGSLSWGTSIEEAFYGIERLEHVATTLMYAKQLGGLPSLPKEEIEYLRELREKIGNRTI